jgi:hypothetical protein
MWNVQKIKRTYLGHLDGGFLEKENYVGIDYWDKNLIG